MPNAIESVLSLLQGSHSCFHAVEKMKRELLKAGFKEVKEKEPFTVKLGDKIFLTRNDSSILAFAVPKKMHLGFRLAATHNDSPTFALKPSPILNRNGVASLNVEPYGGALYAPWFDRPLSFAGRVFYQGKEGIECKLVDVDEDLLVIPSVAIHMNREANKGAELNPAKDLIPLWSDLEIDEDFAEYLAKKCNVDGKILSHDLFLYVRQEPKLVGEDKTLLLAPRLDDLSSAYSSLLAFIESADKEEGLIPAFVSFDNEEVGSLTAQGANSDFLITNLRRVMDCLGLDKESQTIAIARSILLSVDNAHANHPNHPELSDATTHVALNGGIVLKYNAAQKYTTNGESAAYVKGLCLDLGDPYQEFTNRSDMRGGSTLGNISNAEVSLLSADIGIAQLAMHSCVELCGVTDIERMVRLLKAHYSRKE